MIKIAVKNNLAPYVYPTRRTSIMKIVLNLHTNEYDIIKYEDNERQNNSVEFVTSLLLCRL